MEKRSYESSSIIDKKYNYKIKHENGTILAIKQLIWIRGYPQ